MPWARRAQSRQCLLTARWAPVTKEEYDRAPNATTPASRTSSASTRRQRRPNEDEAPPRVAHGPLHQLVERGLQRRGWTPDGVPTMETLKKFRNRLPGCGGGGAAALGIDSRFGTRDSGFGIRRQVEVDALASTASVEAAFDLRQAEGRPEHHRGATSSGRKARLHHEPFASVWIPVGYCMLRVNDTPLDYEPG